MWQQHTNYMEQIKSVNQGTNIVVYTGGSVDEQGRAVSSFYATTYGLQVSSQTLPFRTPDHASTLQIELDAIVIVISIQIITTYN